MVPDPNFEHADLDDAAPAQVLRSLLAAKDLESFVFVTAKRRASDKDQPRARRPSLRP
jgi:hypothetical protein